MTIGIIGFGNFGTLFASMLKKYGKIKVNHYKKNKEIIDKATMIDVEFSDLKTTAECDIVIIAVPISKTKDVIKNIAKFVKPDSIVMDVCSVKVYPCRWLKKYFPNNINTIGSHPMFGPSTTNFNLQKQTWNINEHQIILCPVNISKCKIQILKNIFKDLGLKIIETSPQEHDRQNATALGLVHFLGRSLWDSGIRQQEIFTPGYKDLLKIYHHTTGDTWRLFYDMNNYNPYSKKTRQHFLKSCQKIENIIEENNNLTNIKSLRSLIDNTDNEMINLLSKRFEYVKKIGQIKRENNLPIIDKKRENFILGKKLANKKIDEKFSKKLFELIFKESYKNQ
ncbi:MAG: prephenate dehydrogenase/arogenate dehydrogenase family protein [Patescibacteria group bacterium]|nr:prephenate dehydrogenase/arogenate dehydrogenase family protein [Patescibacteria group bacterium]